MTPPNNVQIPGARLRIVHAVRSHVFAGVERYVASVSAELAARGHLVTVIGGEERAMREAMQGASIELFPGRRTTRAVALELARHARAADIVHVHMTAAEAAALLTRPIVRAPVIATRHFASERGTTRLGRAIAPRIRRMLAKELSISQFVADSTDEPTEVLLNGVANADRIDPIGKIVLVAQRLEPEKYTADAIDAWRISHLSDHGWELWIAGDGTERPLLESRVATDCVGGVRFLGQRDDLASLRNEVGIVLASAPAEPFGLSVAESMAAGLPVVAALGGGHLETVARADPALLYPPGDVRACAALLRRLALDVDERRRAGATLRQFQQEQLNLATHVDRLVEVYRKQTRHERASVTSQTVRPCLVFPGATHRGGVERATWEGLRYLGARYPTTFVGLELDREELPTVDHRSPELPRWGRGALRPAAFRVASRSCLPRDQSTVTVSLGINASPGDVFVVNSLHRSWLRAGQGVRLHGVAIPNAARYLLLRHHVLLALEWDYFRRGRPRAVIAVSRAVADELSELYGVPPGMITVIPNGYDPEQCNPTRRQALRMERRATLGIADDAIVFLFVANELHRKGFGVLLEATARLRDDPFEIHVVGRTPLDGYRDRIADLGLEHKVHYHGATSDIGLFHAVGDLLVLPTQYEAFALTIVEALASGLPVITTTVPGAGDLIGDDVNGLLQHDPNDDAELAALLQRSLNSDDRDAWARAAAASVAGLDWTSLMARYEAVILDASHAPATRNGRRSRA